MDLIQSIRALPMEVLLQRSTQSIADALPPSITVFPCEIGKGKILATIGLDAGNTLLDTIDNVPAFRHVKQLVANGWLDVGDALARAMIDQVCTPADASALKALAEVEVPVNEMEVRIACWSDTGEWLV